MICHTGQHAGAAFADWVRDLRPKLVVTLVKRSDQTSGFTVLPCHWVVEHTFVWLMRHRRLVRDGETSEAST